MYIKSLLGTEDIVFDSNGSGETFTIVDSTGSPRQITGVNATHIPLLIATRDDAIFNGLTLTANTVDAAIVALCSSLSSIHKFTNEAVLDEIQGAGSKVIISAAERQKLLDITDVGSGKMITALERSKLASLSALTADQLAKIAIVDDIFPLGLVMGYPISTIPSLFLECAGQYLDRIVYSDLFGVIGATYGTTDAGNFRLPDYRGQFLRGWDHGRAFDPGAGARTDRGDGTAGDNPGTNQGDEIKSHVHAIDTYNYADPDIPANVSSNDNDGVLYPGAATTNATGGAETRPTNISIAWCIRALIS